jgi:hypothetical protein
MVQKDWKNPKSAVSATTNAPDTRQLQIPDSVIEQILEATKIPPGRRDEVFYAVRSCVEIFIDGRLGEHENRYRMIASLCDRLRGELSRLNNSERRHFGANLQDLETLARIGEGAKGLIPTGRRPHNRPRGSAEYPHIEDLIYDLHVVAGGDLTLYRDDDKTKGSLQAVLDILHELSPVIFPSVSFNKLNAMRRWAQAAVLDDG